MENAVVTRSVLDSKLYKYCQDNNFLAELCPNIGQMMVIEEDFDKDHIREDGNDNLDIFFYHRNLNNNVSGTQLSIKDPLQNTFDIDRFLCTYIKDIFEIELNDYEDISKDTFQHILRSVITFSSSILIGLELENENGLAENVIASILACVFKNPLNVVVILFDVDAIEDEEENIVMDVSTLLGSIFPVKTRK